MAGGGGALDVTLGQFEAGVMSGGAYTLSGGFWYATGTTEQRMFLPRVLK